MKVTRPDVLNQRNGRIQVYPLKGVRKVPSFSEDLREGLSSQPKHLSPKYFYDERGSWLFEEICKTPEYYPYDVERALLAKESDAIIDRVRPGSILELGSGSSKKTTFLLDACERKRCHSLYLPLDVCEEMILDAGKRLLEKYEWVVIGALVGDFCKGFKQLPTSEGSRLFVFLGGTIGNFDEELAERFLRDVHSNMTEDDWFLLGADRVKDIKVLNAAYNDKKGYTAAFNLNMLEVINREFHANFVLERFEHQARFNSKKSRIEMHLKCNEDHEVHLRDLGMKVQFKEGETILTEICRKFTLETLKKLLEGTGFQIDQHFEADEGYFSLVLARPSTR